MTARRLISIAPLYSMHASPTILHLPYARLEVVQREVAHLVLDIVPVHDSGVARFADLTMGQ